MSVTTLFAGILLAQAAPLVMVREAPAHIDVAYSDISRGDNDTAIARILAEGDAAKDPAALINLGTANTRLGNIAKAQDYFRAAMNHRDVVYLELADGSWMDSRRAARKALNNLTQGPLAAR